MERIPFNKAELESAGEEPGMFGRPGRKLFKTPITAKENYLMHLSRETPFWMPMSFGDTTMITPKVPDNIARGFVFEAEKIDNLKEAGGPDMFGVEWEYVPTVGGSMVRGGNPKVPDITEWEKYITFPKVADLMDWEACYERNKGVYIKEDKPLVVTILTGFFERLISFMDFENAAFALVDEDEQEGVHRLFDKLADFYDEYIRYYREYIHADVISFHDDWGSQRAPFFSISTVREMILPYLKRVVDSTHKYGMKFDLHSCGKNELLVPAMIEAGVDSWSGQPMNDFEMLYEKYGDKITLGMPISGLREDMSDEELYAAIEAWVKKHPHALGSVMGAPAKAADFLYEASRKVFCGEA